MPSSSDNDAIEIRLRSWAVPRTVLRGANQILCEGCKKHLRFQYGPPPTGAYCDGCGIRAALKAMEAKERFLEKIPEEWGEVSP